MKNYKLPLVLLTLAGTLFTSCTKEIEEKDEFVANRTMPEEINEVKFIIPDEVASTFNFDEEIEIIQAMSMEGKMSGKKYSANELYNSCATITVDSSATHSLVTIDFGPVNCKGDDGKYRRGAIQVTFENGSMANGSSYSVFVDKYAVNDFEMFGEKNVVFAGLNAEGQPYFNVSMGMNVEKPNGKTISWNSTRQRTWVAGYGDGDASNNVFEVSGNVTGTASDLKSFNVLISENLRVESSCNNIVSGSIQVSGTEFDAHTINYGDGACDGNAMLTLNGLSSGISLR